MASNLLNPPLEAAVCRKMIQALEAQRDQVDVTLTQHPLTHDAYLKNFSFRQALTKAIDELTGIYDREFNV